MKLPWKYFVEIRDLETREAKLAALAEVPDNLRPIVKTHLNNDIAFKRFMRR